MTQSLAQQNITNEKGRATRSQATPFTFTERLDTAYDAEVDGVVTSGDALKPSGNGNFLTPATANDDDIIGFVLYNGVDNSFEGGDYVEVVRNPAQINMEAGASIAKDALVEYDVATKKVVTRTTGTIIGRAFQEATADGDIIPVIVRVG